MESKEGPGAGGAREESALNMFRQMDLKGKSKDDTQLQTVHQNTINTIRVYEEGGGVVQKFSSKHPFLYCSNFRSACRLTLSQLAVLTVEWSFGLRDIDNDNGMIFLLCKDLSGSYFIACLVSFVSTP